MNLNIKPTARWNSAMLVELKYFILNNVVKESIYNFANNEIMHQEKLLRGPVYKFSKAFLNLIYPILGNVEPTSFVTMSSLKTKLDG